MNKNDGGPAFPKSGSELAYPEDGMSMRQWYKGQAIAGLLSRLDNESQVIAGMAGLVADAALEEDELEKERGVLAF